MGLATGQYFGRTSTRSCQIQLWILGFRLRVPHWWLRGAHAECSSLRLAMWPAASIGWTIGPLLADSVEKVGHGFHGRKVRAWD